MSAYTPLDYAMVAGELYGRDHHTWVAEDGTREDFTWRVFPQLDDLDAKMPRLLAEREARLAAHTTNYRIGLLINRKPGGVQTYTPIVLQAGDPVPPGIIFTRTDDLRIAPRTVLNYLDILHRIKQYSEGGYSGHLTGEEHLWLRVLREQRKQYMIYFVRLLQEAPWARRAHAIAAYAAAQKA